MSLSGDNWKYLQIFLLSSSNIITNIFIYPLVLDHIYKMYYLATFQFISIEFGFSLGLIFFVYEIMKVIGIFFWSKVSDRFGFSLSISISLILLAVLNLSLSFINSFVLLLIIRALTGFFNNLGNQTKFYIMELFSSQYHSKVLNVFILFTNINTVLGYLLGSITYFSDTITYKQYTDNANYFKKDNYYIWKIGLNKYYIQCWILVTINLIAFILNFFVMKPRIISRRTLDLKNTNRPTSNIAFDHESLRIDTKEDRNSSRFTISGQDHDNNMNNNNNNANAKVIKKKSRKSPTTKNTQVHIQLVEEANYDNQDNLSDIVNNHEVEYQNNIPINNEEAKDKISQFKSPVIADTIPIGTDEASLKKSREKLLPIDQKYNILNELKTAAIDIKSTILRQDSDKSNEVSIDNDNIIENNDNSIGIERYDSATKVIPEIGSGGNIENIGSPVNESKDSSFNNDNMNIKIMNSNRTQDEFKDVELSELEHGKMMDVKHNNFNNFNSNEASNSTNVLPTISNTNNPNNNSKMLIDQASFPAFKVSFLFTFIQISDAISFYLFLLLNFTPKEYIGFGLNSLYLGLNFATIYAIYTIFYFFFSMWITKAFLNEFKYSLFYVLLCICIVMTVILPLPVNILDKENIILIVMLTNLIDFGRLLSFSLCLSKLNMLITKIQNVQAKKDIQKYQTFISNILKALFGLLTCAFYWLFVIDNNLHIMLFAISVFASVLLIFVFLFIKLNVNIFS